jgi:hypothetical protein
LQVLGYIRHAKAGQSVYLPRRNGGYSHRDPGRVDFGRGSGFYDLDGRKFYSGGGCRELEGDDGTARVCFDGFAEGVYADGRYLEGIFARGHPRNGKESFGVGEGTFIRGQEANDGAYDGVALLV